MIDINAAIPCATCTTPLACSAYVQCINRPLVKAHPAAAIVARDERLERVKQLSGADTEGFLPQEPEAGQ